MEKFLLGTYTRNTSQGIYQVIFDDLNEQLVNVELVAKEVNPTYLAIDTNQHLFSVSNFNHLGGVAAYSTNDIPYPNLNRVLQDGAAPCYISVDKERNLVFSANYHTGQLQVYQIQADGSLQLTDQVQRTGHSIHENQQSSHLHYADLTPDNRLIACDLGTDEIILYNVSNLGKVEELSTTKLPAGTGPRHLIFNPKQPDIFYVIGELTNIIYTMQYDSTNASMTILNSTSALPDGDNTQLGGAAIKISRDGNFLYASTRCDNAVSVFNIEPYDKLTLIQHIATNGQGPRDFALTNNDNYLIVGHQNTDCLSLFKRDRNSGLLTFLNNDCRALSLIHI